MSRFYARNGAGDLLARYSFIESLLPGRRVLELGAAGVTGGASALYLAEHGAAAVVSVDDDAAGVEQAARESQHPFVQFKNTAIGTLPQGAFDLVLIADGAALVSDPARVASVRRLLGPRGRLVTALPASEEGNGLAQLAGEPAAGEQPAFESFVGALGAHFAFVEIATQSATVGYVVAMGQDPEPEISIDGSLSGTSDTAWYVAICGDAPCNLKGLGIVALPTQPLFEAVAERERLATGGGAAIEEAQRASAEAQAAMDAAMAELETVRAQHADAAAALEAALLEAERRDAELAALEAERAGLNADRDAMAEAQAEAERRAAVLREELEAQAARIGELEAALEAERDVNFDLRTTAEKVQALEEECARQRDEGARAAEVQAQAAAELAAVHARAEETDAALHATRSEAQASRAALEAALFRATAAEGRVRELEEGTEAVASAAAEQAVRLAAELEAMRGAAEAAATEQAALREAEGARAAELAAELAAVRAEAEGLAAERDALRERVDSSRLTSEELQGRAAELEVRAAEVDRLSAELARRDDASAEANTARETLEAQLAELGARLESEEERLRRAEAQEAEARALLDAARAELAARSGGSAEVAQLTAALAEAIGERDRFEALAEEARDATGLARLRDEVAQRSARIVEQEREIARLAAIVTEVTSHPPAGAAPGQAPSPEDAERSQELERRVEEAERLRANAERRVAEVEALAASELVEEGRSGAAKVLERLKSERDSLQAQVMERDARLARMQREVADKTDRLGRLAKEMGELKAKGIGKLFK